MPPRYRLEFDPDGYKYAQEPGFDWSILGSDLASRADATGKPFLIPSDNLWNPMGSKWLVTQPYHLEPNWDRHAFLGDQVVGLSEWDINASVAFETKISNVVGGPDYPGNKFIVIPTPNTITDAFSAVAHLGNLYAAAGVTMPTGMKVMGVTKWHAPYGISPNLRRVVYPPPYDSFVFGFANFALLLTDGDVFLLETTDSRQTWKLVRALLNPAQQGIGYQRYKAYHGWESRQNPAEMQAHSANLQTLYTSLVGVIQLYLGNSPNMTWMDLRDRVPTLGSQQALVKTGPWWFAAMPRQQVAFQAQVPRYMEALHGDVNSAGVTAEYFNLGDEGYFPTMPLELTFKAMLTKLVGETLETTLLPATDPEKVGIKYRSPYFGSELSVMAIDKNNQPWKSNGQNGSGGLYLHMIPGTAPSTGTSAGRLWTHCYPTGVVAVNVEIPPKLVDRVNDPRALYSDQWRNLTGEAFFRNPFNKKLTLEVDDNGLKAIEAMNLHRRHDFPVHLTEDVDGDESYAAIRARWWVEDMNWKELKDVDGNPLQPFRRYLITCRGMLYRVENSAWLYQADLVDASNNGRLEHTEAARKTLRTAGLDTDNPDDVLIEVDTGPVEALVLPGTLDTEADSPTTKQNAPYGPDWDEPKGSYVNRLALTWRGWVFVENLRGTAYYVSDPVNNLLDRFIMPATTFRLYRSHASALAAGKPRQYFGASKALLEPLVSNFMRVIGQGEDEGPLSHLILRDKPSVEGPIASVRNFVGEWVRAVAIKPKMAVSTRAQRQIGNAIFKKVKLDRLIHQFPVPMLPWHIIQEGGGTGADVGFVFESEGHGLKYLVSHLEFKLYGDGLDQGETDFSGEELPPFPALPPAPGT